MRPLTFRTQLTINALTVLLIGLLITTTTLARTGSATILSQTSQTSTTTISYQGQLTNSSGQPLSATLPMSFALYTTPTGGPAVWTETRSGASAVPVANGLFSVLLGSVTPLDPNLLNQDLWLGISVDGDAEMTPREKLGSVPYAVRAGSVPDGSITQTKAPGLVAGPVANTKVAHGQANVQEGTIQPGLGNVTISLTGYSFTQTPTILCSLAGPSGFNWSCHVEYETKDSFTIWVVRRDNGRGWGTVPVRWIAIGN